MSAVPNACIVSVGIVCNALRCGCDQAVPLLPAPGPNEGVEGRLHKLGVLLDDAL